MALIKNANTTNLVRDAIVLDLGDLQRQAERIKSRARERADRVIAKARDERERLISGAYEEGLERGLEEGRAQGRAEGHEAGRAEILGEAREEFDHLSQTWTQALDAFAERREQLFLNARTEVIALALTIAAKIVKRVVEVDPLVVRDQMAAAMDLLRDQTRFVISVHPDDQKVAEEALPELIARLGGDPHARIVLDDTLQRGSCVVDTASGRIDAGVESQLEVIIDAISPIGALGGIKDWMHPESTQSAESGETPSEDSEET